MQDQSIWSIFHADGFDENQKFVPMTSSKILPNFPENFFDAKFLKKF